MLLHLSEHGVEFAWFTPSAMSRRRNFKIVRAVAELEKAALSDVQCSPGILPRRVPDGVCHAGDVSRTWPSFAEAEP